MIGQELNKRYAITTRLGKGAMGTVYRATDSQTGQEVALKVISSELAVDPAMLERFKREGESLRALKHLNIVGFMDAFQHDEHYVIVMEYVRGGSLFELIKAGPLSIERARQIALDLCDALIRSHRLNIIHRDIKPENILIAEDGTPKLADFGVAHLSEGTRITRSGTQVGTPYYMAPEAWSGKTDAQSDIWSLGVVLFEMLTAQVPFDGDTGPIVMNKVLTTPPPDIKKLRADVSPGLVKIISRMLTRDKTRRYRTMREVAVDLERDQHAAIPLPEKAKPASKKEIKKPGSINKKIMGVGIAGIVIILLGIGAMGLKTLIQNLPIATAATSSPEGPATPALPASTPVLAEEITDASGIPMRLVPKGTFTRGSEEYDVTKPVHEVYLDGFYMDKYEVTNALYKICVDEGVCDQPKEISSSTRSRYWANVEFEDYPVIHVDWNMAKAYCEWREALLPTEAQWEKAARGTDERTYPWGDSYGTDHANDINQNEQDTVAVGSFELGVSPYGIYDMSGNVDEWVADFFSDIYYRTSPSTNPLGPDTGETHVLRGGSWNDNTPTYYRDNNGPGFSSDDVGFRCARSASTTATQAIIFDTPISTHENQANNWSGILSVRPPTLNEIRAEIPVSIWDSNNLNVRDMRSPGLDIYSGEAQYGKEYLFPVYWCTTTSDLLTYNTDYINTLFSVNGEVVPEKYVFNYNYDTNTGWVCNYHAIVIGDWVKNENYKLEIKRIFLKDLSDGQSSYSAGEYTYSLDVKAR